MVDAPTVRYASVGWQRDSSLPPPSCPAPGPVQPPLADGMRFPSSPRELLGLSSATWYRALAVAARWLYPSRLVRVHLDNGIRLAPTSNGLPPSARYALPLGAS